MPIVGLPVRVLPKGTPPEDMGSCFSTRQVLGNAVLRFRRPEARMHAGTAVGPFSIAPSTVMQVTSLTMATKTKKFDWQLAPAPESKDHVRIN